MNLIDYLHERGITWFDMWTIGPPLEGDGLQMPHYSKDCFWSRQLLTKYSEYKDSH